MGCNSSTGVENAEFKTRLTQSPISMFGKNGGLFISTPPLKDVATEVSNRKSSMGGGAIRDFRDDGLEFYPSN